MNATPIAPASTPLECPSCGQIFLSPPLWSAKWFKCPHCWSALAFSPDGLIHVTTGEPGDLSPVIETPEALEERERTGSTHARLLAIAGSIVAVALAIGLARLSMAPTPAADVPSPPPLEDPPADRLAKAEAFEAAARALGQPGWAEAFPHFRESSRLRPLMERYHARYLWHPLILTELTEARLESRDGVPWALLTAKTERHRLVQLAVEKTAEGWKVDWEALADAPAFEWQEFYQQRPPGVLHLRAEALRGSVSDAYTTSAGTAPDDVLPVSLFCRHRGDAVIALVPRSSELGQQLDRTLTWDAPQRIVADISIADAASAPPRVVLQKIAAHSWADPTADQ